MNNIKLFENPTFGSVRVIEKDGEPWFVAKDICDILELGNRQTSLALLDDDEKGIHTMDTPGGKQEMSVISESGLYSLILRSRKPEARNFKRWVTGEVLPSIRKTGAYMTPATIESIINDPDSFLKLVQELARNKKQTAELEKRCQKLEMQKESYENAWWNDRPKAAFHDTFNRCGNCITMAQMANQIIQNTGRNIGEKKLFRYCRNAGLICNSKRRKFEPTQRAINENLMKVEIRSYEYPCGSRQYRQTVVTPKGQQHLLNVFLDGFRLF